MNKLKENWAILLVLFVIIIVATIVAGMLTKETMNAKGEMVKKIDLPGSDEKVEKAAA